MRLPPVRPLLLRFCFQRHICRINSLVWAEQLEDGGASFGYAIAVDNAANVYISGSLGAIEQGGSLTAGFGGSIVCGEDAPPFLLTDDIDAYAAKYNPFEPLCIKGDVNEDGIVDLLDIGSFIAKVTGNVYCVKADMNCDGILDLLDIAPFVCTLSNP